MLRYLFLSILTFSFLISIAQESNAIKDLVPEGNYFESWVVKDSAKVANGDNLFALINGGADVYLEYGFEEVVLATYKNPAAVSIQLEVYEMTDTDAAFGVYTLNSNVIGKFIELGDEGILYDYYLHFRKGKYYIRCSASRNDVEIIEMIKRFAAYADENISIKGKEPALVHAFDLADKEITHIKYIKGQIGLKNLFNFGHGSIAGFNEGVVGKSEDKMIFVFAYEDDKKRREWFASTKGKMQMNKKFTDYTTIEDGFTVLDKSGIVYSFRPKRNFFAVFKGLDWEGSTALFQEMNNNLEKVGH